MAICKKCGAEMADEAKFCPACGAAVDDTAEKANGAEVTAAPAETAGAKSNDNDKVMGVLAYLSWLVLIPLLMAKESEFARFHANQGIVLAIAEIFAFVVCGILSLIPVVGVLFAILEWVVSIVCFIFSILGIVNAANGAMKELPIVGKFRILK